MAKKSWFSKEIKDLKNGWEIFKFLLTIGLIIAFAIILFIAMG